jgi:tetratricopeptide (TPR) repeat protein
MDAHSRYFPTKSSFWHPLILVSACFLAYSNIFVSPFIFDDMSVVLNNPNIFSLWPHEPSSISPTRIVAAVTFSLNYAWAGFSPAEYHLVNILIHCGAGLFLYGVIRRTLLLPRWNARFDSSAPGLAFAIALLWIVHPLQTESVTYIAQRIEALMGLFFLMAFYGFIRAQSSPHSKIWYAAAVVACAIGMGTKEIMVCAPILLFLYDGVFIAASWKDLARQRWKLHSLFFSTWIVFFGLLVMGIAQATEEQAALFTTDSVRWDYALTQLNVLIHYLKLSLIPYPLCLDYRWPLVNSFSEALWPGTLTLLLAGGAVWALWRRSWLGFIGAWFFIILAPTSSINPLPDVAFEHRMYLPLAGVLAFIVILIHEGLGRYCRASCKTPADAEAGVPPGMKPPISSGFGRGSGLAARRGWEYGNVILFGIVVVTFGILTHFRNETYHSEESMWKDVLLKRPDNFRTTIALSSAFINEGRYEEADPLCTTLLSRLPDFSKLSPEIIKKNFSRPGRPPLPLYYSMAHNNLGNIALNTNHPEAAIQHFREAIRVMPGAAWAYLNLGRVLFSENHISEAIAEWNRVLEIQPGDSQTHGLLGIAFSRNKQYQQAAKHFELSIKYNPAYWFARAEVAWLLATCPSSEVRNGTLAIEMAKPLLDVSKGESARAADILAAAYAEAGDYSNAVKYAEQALVLIARTPGMIQTNSISSNAVQARLNGYKARQPFRE